MEGHFPTSQREEGVDIMIKLIVNDASTVLYAKIVVERYPSSFQENGMILILRRPTPLDGEPSWITAQSMA